jgi:hypothetical protein
MLNALLHWKLLLNTVMWVWDRDKTDKINLVIKISKFTTLNKVVYWYLFGIGQSGLIWPTLSNHKIQNR